MANDPNRDLIPVREDSYRTGKGSNDKFDHQILGKLSRCELEDRFLRLLDEQTHIKKLANTQEEKIKRLGTKLLRLINEKKNGKKISELNKETEDLNLRIIELEHENYTLKDKNIVLRQQLSSQSRHLTHRSPIRSNHTSPLMTMRQSATLPRSDAYDAANKIEANDMQLQEAEAHIRELNEEIKSLHNKIDYLQQNLEKNNLDNRKIKVSENIELIRLQRSLKQQAVQIAALQEQVRNSEKSQKILKDDLIKAHNENDEALHLISEKQNEILSLCSKLEETNLNRLEEDELKERINDLMMERDSLKERSDLLMKSIGVKAEESEKINELQKLLAEEKSKKEKLEEALGVLKNNFKDTTEIVETSHCEKIKTVYRAQQTTPEGKEMINFACNTYEDSESSRSQESSVNRELDSDTEPSESRNGKITVKKKSSTSERCAVEKMKLELELQYLREMLRSQTLRCEAQQAEISRLMYELKLNEDKCNETLQRLDWHLRIFESLEVRAQQSEPTPAKSPEPIQEKAGKVEPEEKLKPAVPVRKEVTYTSSEYDRKTAFDNESLSYRRESSEENLPSKLVSSHTTIQQLSVNEPSKKIPMSEHRKRFVDQTFLESSDEELNTAATLEKQAFMETLEKADERRGRGKMQDYQDVGARRLSTPGHVGKPTPRKREPSNISVAKNVSESSLPSKPYEKNFRREVLKRPGDDSLDGSENVKITILWFKIRAESSFWKDESIEMFFVDFTFLDLNGAETETPQSLPKPRNPDMKCEFNFSQTMDIQGNRLKMMLKLLKNPEATLFLFKLVSDSEKYDGTNNECEDIGIAVMTVKEFLDFCNGGPFHIQVKNYDNTKEVIGTLAVSVEATPRLLTK